MPLCVVCSELRAKLLFLTFQPTPGEGRSGLRLGLPQAARWERRVRKVSGRERRSFGSAQEVYRILLSSLRPVMFSSRKHTPLKSVGPPHDISRMEALCR